MKSKIAIFLLSLLWGSYTFGQQTLLFDSGKMVDSVLSTVPTRNVVNTATGIEVTYDFSSAVILQDDLFPGHYLWRMDGFGLNEVSGTPSTLLRIDQFGIPDGKVGRIEVVETAYKDFEYVLSPARPPLVDDGNEIHTKDNVQPIDPTIAIFPEQIVQEEGIQKYRGKGILNVRVSPVQYNASTGKTRVFTHIKYVVSFAERKGQTRVYSPGDTLIHSVATGDNFLLNTLLNNLDDEGKQKAGASTRLNQQDYLIISVPKYESAIQQFSEWKKLMGFNVYTIIKSSWTTATVKSEVRKFYDENANFYFLLIVGDHEDVPAVSSSTGSLPHVTDLPYACMDGDNDYVPDVYMGRLSVSTASEASIVVNKIISYERNPITTASFYNTGVNCAYFQDDGLDDGEEIDGYADRRFAQTAEDVRNYLLNQGKTVQRIYYTKPSKNPTNWNKTIFSYGEPIPAELRKPGFAWNGNATDIINAINAGVFYVLHRDHGNPTCWGDPRFTQSDIEKLSNGNKLPVVFSMNCQTGQFDGRTCFTETFLRKSNGGCVAIYGATQTSYSGKNDVLTGGMFDAIWPDPGLRIVIPNKPLGGTTPTPTYQLGQILNQGLARMSEIYGMTGAYYTREIFHCFGDPSMRIYTDVPTAFSGVTVNRGNDNVTVSLSNGERATITFYNLINGKVTSYVGSNAVYDTKTPSYVTVCVSGHNKIPDVRQGITPSDIYIQNETITGNKTYIGKIIKIGTNVTGSKPQGDVVIKSGATVNFYGNDVQILPGTTIEQGADVTILTQ